MKRMFLSTLGLTLAALVPQISYALPSIACGTLPGCPGGVSESYPDWIPAIVQFLLNAIPMYLGGLSLIFVLIGGLYMILSIGDEGRVETGRKTVMAALGGLALAMFADTLITFVLTEDYIQPGATDTILGIINSVGRIVFTFFNVALIIAVLANGVRMVLSRGNEDQYSKALNGFFWAALGAIIINLAVRIVTIILGFIL